MPPQCAVRKAGHYIENGTDITELLTSSELQRNSNSRDQLPDRYIPKPYIYVIKKLGGGGQGVVFLAELSSEPILRRPPANSIKALFAVKLIPTLKNGNIPRELAYLQRFKGSHPRLCLLEAFNEVPGYYALYFGFNDAGDLWHLIQGFKMRGEIFPEAFIWHVLGQLVEAVYFLQNPNLEKAGEWKLWHRDIKPENIFLKWPWIKHSNIPVSNWETLAARMQTMVKGNIVLVNSLAPLLTQRQKQSDEENNRRPQIFGGLVVSYTK